MRTSLCTVGSLLATSATTPCECGKACRQFHRLEGIVSPAYTICVPRPAIDAEFAGYLFKYPPTVHQFLRHSQGMVNYRLNLKFYHFSQDCRPPPKCCRHTCIVIVFKSLDKEVELFSNIELDTLKRQKKGLMQKLLTGQFRVRLSKGERHDGSQEDDHPGASLGLPADYAELLELLKGGLTGADQGDALGQPGVDPSLLGHRPGDRVAAGAGWLGPECSGAIGGRPPKGVPGVSGFSRSNVFRMRAFYLAYRPAEEVVQPVRQSPRGERIAARRLAVDRPAGTRRHSPWGHNIVLLQKVKDAKQRLWYAAQDLGARLELGHLPCRLRGAADIRQGGRSPISPTGCRLPSRTWPSNRSRAYNRQSPATRRAFR